MARRIVFVLGAMLCVFTLSLGYAAAADSVSELQNKEPGTGETSIGSLVADAFRSQMRAEVGFVAAGDLKASDAALAAGKVKPEEVAAYLAYPNDKLAVLSLDGKTIRAALERSVSSYPRPGLSFLQVSGLTYAFDPKKPSGQRVDNISIGNAPISADKKYTVAVMKSLADGALGYWKIWTKENIITKSESMTCSDALQRFLLANPKLDYSKQNRINAAN